MKTFPAVEKIRKLYIFTNIDCLEIVRLLRPMVRWSTAVEGNIRIRSCIEFVQSATMS